MSSDLHQVHLSSIDEDRFNIRTARASIATLDRLPSVMDFCRANNVVLLIARCPASEVRIAQAMEVEGFVLMDTLVYYVRNLVKGPIPSDIGDIPVRPVRPGEADDVRDVAANAFRGYFGHYHADDKLDHTKCDEVYGSWAFRSCVSRDDENEVLVADEDGSIVGFITLRVNSPQEGEGALFGVARSVRGRGIGRSLMIYGLKWCLSKGASRMIISTQIANLVVQRIWVRLGFEPSHACYTFHKWFDGT